MCPMQCDREADGSREVRGDGRGLGDDGQIGMAEDLVPGAGNRLIRQSHQSLQDVSNWRGPWHLVGPGDIETSRAVMQQRWIRWPRCHRHEGVALMPSRTNGVEAPAGLLQLPSHKIQMPARGLRPENSPPPGRLGSVSKCYSTLRR